MNHHSYLLALSGGCLIGFGSLVATALTGKIPGVSGVFARLLRPNNADKSWRLLFLLGIVGGAALSFLLCADANMFRVMRPLGVTAIAGLLVGFGTRLGRGCTSGHGVCGVGRAEKDSIAATVIFVATAMVTVLIYNRILS